jgi:hypothetical protein
MFRATVCPSSEEPTVFMRQLVLVILYGWLTGMQFHSTLHTRQSSIQSNKYQVSHKYSCFSWWWAQSRPKHVEKRNKHTKNNCAPSWLYLQDYTRMHGQQNIKYTINTRWLKSVLTITWISTCTAVRIVFQMLSHAKWALSVNWMSGRKCSRSCSRKLGWSCVQGLYILQAILTKTFTVQNFPYLCPNCKSRPRNFAYACYCASMHCCQNIVLFPPPLFTFRILSLEGSSFR